MNGMITNALVENNIVHDNGTTGIDLENGTTDSLFENNVIYSEPDAQPFILSNYSGGATAVDATMSNNTIINNTFIGVGGVSGRQNCIRVNVSSSASCTNLVIKNNILDMTNVGNSSATVVQFDNDLWWNTATIENNVMDNANGSSALEINGTSYTLTQAQRYPRRSAATSGAAPASPITPAAIPATSTCCPAARRSTWA